MNVWRRRSRKLLESVVLVAGCFVIAAAIVPRSRPRPASVYGEEERAEPVHVGTNVQDYARFRHSNPMHARMPCLLCHKREDNSAAPKFPGHLPCSGCHVEQFADNKSPICTICHTETGLKRFPGLQSFNVQFDHGKHLRQTGCATCHTPSRRGVALSVPSGVRAHTTCYQCHGPNTSIGGRNIGSCGTCHAPGRPAKNSDWAPAFAKNFSHAEHRGKNMTCSTCHTVRAGLRRGAQVSAPAAAMHFARSGTLSCATCHNNGRAFGGNDFADCKRCHEGATFRF